MDESEHIDSYWAASQHVEGTQDATGTIELAHLRYCMPKDFNERRNALIAAVEADVVDAIVTILIGDDRYTRGPTIPHDARVRLKADMAMIISGMKPEIVRHHIEGTLLLAAEQDQEISRELKTIEDFAMANHSSGAGIPIAYVANPVRSGGRTHSSAEVKAALDIMERYLADSAEAIKIIDGDKPSKLLEVNREKLKHFINNVKQRLADTKDDSPVDPLSYVGSTTNARQCRDQHLHRQSSNFIMHMFMAAMNHEREPDDLFAIKFTPLWVCTRPTQVEAAAILLDYLCCGQVRYGAGFAHHPPGAIDALANDVPDEVWASCLDFAFDALDIEERRKAVIMNNRRLAIHASYHAVYWQVEGLIDAGKKFQEANYGRSPKQVDDTEESEQEPQTQLPETPATAVDRQESQNTTDSSQQSGSGL